MYEKNNYAKIFSFNITYKGGNEIYLKYLNRFNIKRIRYKRIKKIGKVSQKCLDGVLKEILKKYVHDCFKKKVWKYSYMIVLNRMDNKQTNLIWLI